MSLARRTGRRRYYVGLIGYLFMAANAHAQEPPPNVTPPVVLTHIDATYPPSALARGVHADVLLAVTVDADGHVTKVDVLTSGGADIDEAAIVAVRQWTFVPAKRDGKAMASRIRVPFHFAPPAPWSFFQKGARLFR